MTYNPGDILLSKYRIEALAGQGVFSRVYLATHLDLQIPRALKVLQEHTPGLAKTDYQDYLRRFQFEAVLGARLDDPHILRVHDFHRQDGVLILVMDYAAGGSLAARLASLRESSERMPVAEALQTAKETALGLAVIHNMDLVHSNLKPDNILFTTSGSAVITGLGLAQIPGGSTFFSQFSRPGLSLERTAYASPELINQSDLLKPPSDIYTLGLLLFEMLTDKNYQGLPLGMLPSSMRDELPPWLDQLVMSLLAAEPEKRPWDGSEAARQIEQAIQMEHTRLNLLRRKDEVERQRRFFNSALAEGDLASAGQVLAILKALGSEGQAHVPTLEKQLAAHHQADRQKQARLASLEKQARAAIQARSWELADRLIERIKELGGAAVEHASQLTKQAAAARDQAEERDRQIKQIYQDSQNALAAADWQQVDAGLKRLQELGPTARTYTEILQRQFRQARRVTVADPARVKRWLMLALLIGLGTIVAVAGYWATPHLVGWFSEPSSTFSPSQQLSGLTEQPVLTSTSTHQQPAEPASTASELPPTDPNQPTETLPPPNTSPSPPTTKPEPAVTELGPVLSGTFMPPSQVISPENASHLVELARWSKGVVETARYSPDGRLLATASSMGVTLYDTATLEPVRQVDTTTWVKSLAFSPDSQWLATGDINGNLRLWQTADWQLTREWKAHNAQIGALEFAPDGATLASGSADRRARLWEVSTGELAQEFKGHTAEVESLAFSPSGDKLASGSKDSTVRIWNPADDTKVSILRGHQGGVTSLDFSPDGKILASASLDKSIRQWDVSFRTTLSIIQGHANSINSLEYSPDGALLATGSDDETIRIWRANDGSSRRTLFGHTLPVLEVAFAPDGQSLVSASSDNTVRTWRVSDFTLLDTLTGYSGPVISLDFAPNGQTLASGSSDEKVYVWQFDNGALLQALVGHTSWVNDIVYSPDGQVLASGSNDETIRMWQMPAGDLQQVIKPPGLNSDISSLDFSPDGKTLAASSRNKETTYLWRIPGGAFQLDFSGDNAAYNPDGSLLASSLLNQIRLFKTASPGAVPQILKPSTSSQIETRDYVDHLAIAPVGDSLVGSYRDYWLRWWNTTSGTMTHEVKGQESMQGLSISPDSRLLAVACGKKGIYLYQYDDGKFIRFLTTPDSQVYNDLSFSPDGKYLATGLSDGTIQVWGLP